MMGNHERKKTEILTVSYLLMSVLLAGMLRIAGSAGNGNQMILCYAALLISMLFGLLCYFCLLKISDRKCGRGMYPATVKLSLPLSFFFLFFILFVLRIGLDGRFGAFSYSTHQIYLPDIVFWFFVVSVFSFCIAYLPKEQMNLKYDLPFYAVALMVSAIGFFYCYRPNIFNLNFYSAHHVTAVTHSIYNALYGVPFTVPSSSVYGHYSLFFRFLRFIPVEKYKLIPASIGLVSVLTVFLYAFIVRKTVKKRITGILCLFSLAVLLKYKSVYLQMFPLRYLFPFAVLSYVLWFYRKNLLLESRIFWGGFVLCGFGLVWQTDSGISSVLAYVLCIFLSVWQTEPLFSPKMRKVYLKSFVGILLSFAVMIAVIGSYDLLMGGRFDLPAMFYPLLGGEGYTSGLQTPLADDNFLMNMIPPLMFILVLIIGAKETSLFRNRSANRDISAAFAAVFGLGQCYYYFNRSIAGISCTFPYLFLMMAVVTEIAFTIELPVLTKRLLRSISIACLLIFSTSSVSFLTSSVSAIGIEGADELIYNTESICRMSAEVAENVPENTYAVGESTQEVYSILGWDTKYHLRDSSDLFGIALKQMKAEIEEEPMILITSDIAEELNLDNWKLKWECKENRITLQLYERSKYV